MANQEDRPDNGLGSMDSHQREILQELLTDRPSTTDRKPTNIMEMAQTKAPHQDKAGADGAPNDMFNCLTQSTFVNDPNVVQRPLKKSGTVSSQNSTETSQVEKQTSSQETKPGNMMAGNPGQKTGPPVHPPQRFDQGIFFQQAPMYNMLQGGGQQHSDFYQPSLPLNATNIDSLLKTSHSHTGSGSKRPSSSKSRSGESTPVLFHAQTEQPFKRARLNNNTGKTTKSPDDTAEDTETEETSDAHKNLDIRRQRFLRTREVLEKSGLMDITMRTADLIKNNWTLGKQIEELKLQTAYFINSIL